MRLNKLHMVFICDENRNKVGIITMEDILEQLVGEIYDEADDIPADLSQPGKEAAV
jgi:CBS domain containing-hemolysin-like protein